MGARGQKASARASEGVREAHAGKPRDGGKNEGQGNARRLERRVKVHAGKRATVGIRGAYGKRGARGEDGSGPTRENTQGGMGARGVRVRPRGERAHAGKPRDGGNSGERMVNERVRVRGVRGRTRGIAIRWK